MGLPSFKKLFNLRSNESYQSLLTSFNTLRGEFISLNKSYDKVIEENARLRDRLAKAGLKLSALESIRSAELRDEKDIVNELEEACVEVVEKGIARVKQLSPDTSVSYHFEGSTVGYFVNHVMNEYAKVPQGAKACEFFESLDEHQMKILKAHFSKQYVSFKVDSYNTVCVLAAMYDSGWNVPVDTPVVNKLLKQMGSQAMMANAIMLCLPNNAKFRKTGSGKIDKIEQLFDYLIKNPTTDKTIGNLCKSFEVSTTTVSRFIYLAFLMTEKKDWREVL